MEESLFKTINNIIKLTTHREEIKMKKIIQMIATYFTEYNRIQERRIRAMHVDAYWGG
jgi:hypothetical protein